MQHKTTWKNICDSYSSGQTPHWCDYFHGPTPSVVTHGSCHPFVSCCPPEQTPQRVAHKGGYTQRTHRVKGGVGPVQCSASGVQPVHAVHRTCSIVRAMAHSTLQRDHMEKHLRQLLKWTNALLV